MVLFLTLCAGKEEPTKGKGRAEERTKRRATAPQAAQLRVAASCQPPKTRPLVTPDRSTNSTRRGFAVPRLPRQRTFLPCRGALQMRGQVSTGGRCVQLARPPAFLTLPPACTLLESVWRGRTERARDLLCFALFTKKKGRSLTLRGRSEL